VSTRGCILLRMSLLGTLLTSGNALSRSLIESKDGVIGRQPVDS
jgi:hypothetical protein